MLMDNRLFILQANLLQYNSLFSAIDFNFDCIKFVFSAAKDVSAQMYKCNDGYTDL